MGKDNIIRSIRIRTGKRIIERPIQLLYPMELHCDSKSTTSNTQEDKTLNANVEEFRPKMSGKSQCGNLKVTYNLMNCV